MTRGNRSRTAKRLIWLATLSLLPALLLAAGCSDDGESPPDDTGKDATVGGDADVSGEQGAADAAGTQGTGGTGGTPGHSMQEMTFDGSKRIFAVHVPTSYSDATPTPLLLHFHGWRSLPAGVSDEIKYVWAPSAQTSGFIAVAPEALECPELNPSNPFGCFQEPRDGPFVKALVEHLGQLYNLDLKQLYLSGHSGGAFFVQGHGLRHPSTYVAAVTFSGGCISSSDQYGNSCSVYKTLAATATRKIPFFVVHHADDQVVPVTYSAALIKVLKDAGHPTDAISTYDPGSTGHSIDPSTVPQIWAWLTGFALP